MRNYGFVVELRDSNPGPSLQEQLLKCPFVDLGVVMRAVAVREICADVLRDVTVLAALTKSELLTRRAA
jgi:hypothetical protein